MYLFCSNNSIDRVDLLGKKDMPNCKKAFGLTAGGSVVAKLAKYGLVAGSQLAIIFFPASCEVAGYSVQAGLMRNLTEWSPVIEDDFPSIDDFQRFEVGLNAGLGAGFEAAHYIGDDLADADSFEGVFHTAQGAVGPGGISLYLGDEDENGGRWIGGTGSLGPGVGLAKIDWMYKHHGNVIDLDDDYGISGRCLCAALRYQIAGFINSMRYF